MSHSDDSDGNVEEIIFKKVKPVGTRGKKAVSSAKAGAVNLRSTKNRVAVEQPWDQSWKHVRKSSKPEQYITAIAPKKRAALPSMKAGGASGAHPKGIVRGKTQGQKRTAEECLEGSPAKWTRHQAAVQQDKVAARQARVKQGKKVVEEVTDGLPSKRTRSRTSQPAANIATSQTLGTTTM